MPALLIAAWLAAPATLSALPHPASSLGRAALAQADDEQPSPRSRRRSSDDEEPPRSRSRATENDEGADAPPPRKSRSPKAEEDAGPAPRAREDGPSRKPTYGDAPRRRPRADLTENEESPESLGQIDTLGTGLGAESTFGLLFVSAPEGGVDLRATAGLRLSWDFGRLLPTTLDETLRDMFSFEAAYFYSAVAHGTRDVNTNTRFNYFTGSVQAGYPSNDWLLYVQLGGLLAYEATTYHVAGGEDISPSGTHGGLVYGVGARYKHYVSDTLGIITRVDYLRFRRSYMNDSELSLSLGVAF